ncbi:MAG: CoA ester lyase [Gemmatimonadetes bacterium]|nr:CoA ester lyase [Gemmatimonadota bacterium]
MDGPVYLRRSILFFPATRPDRFEKAVATGADAVCVDLEDAVAPDAKDEGRAAALALLERLAATRQAPDPGFAVDPSLLRRVEVILRINDPESAVGRADLDALLAAGARPDSMMVPKVRAPEEVRRVGDSVARRGAHLPLSPLIETVQGLASVEAIAALPGISALVLGGVDLSAELGCAMDWDALLYARSRVVHAAALASIDAIDMPYLDVSSPEGLEREARGAARVGFRGKVAIHPSQIPVIHAAFSPAAQEIQRARRIIEAYEQNRGGVLLVDGKLVERPVILAAQRTLAIAEGLEAGGSAARPRAEPQETTSD